MPLLGNNANPGLLGLGVGLLSGDPAKGFATGLSILDSQRQGRLAESRLATDQARQDLLRSQIMEKQQAAAQSQQGIARLTDTIAGIASTIPEGELKQSVENSAAIALGMAEMGNFTGLNTLVSALQPGAVSYGDLVALPSALSQLLDAGGGAVDLGQVTARGRASLAESKARIAASGASAEASRALTEQRRTLTPLQAESERALTEQRQRQDLVTTNNVRGAIALKMARGEPLTEGEKAAFDATRPASLVNITEGGDPFTEFTKRFGAELAETDVKSIGAVNERAQSAQTRIDQVEQFMSALPTFRTGSFGNLRGELAGIAELFGLTADELGSATGVSLLNAASSRLSIEVAKELKGSLSNKELAEAQGAVPNLVKTREGNRILAEIIRRTSARDLLLQTEQESFLARYATSRPRDEDGKPLKTLQQHLNDVRDRTPVFDEALKARIDDAARAEVTSTDEAGVAFVRVTTEPEGQVPAGCTIYERPDGSRFAECP